MSGNRILVVEDDAVIAVSLSERLQGWGYDVASCATGEEAVAAVIAHAADVVLMDIRLGGEMDGTEAARLITERFELPVIFLTAHADEALVKMAARSEPYGYLLKPVQAGELRAALTIAQANHALRVALRLSERRFRTFFENNAVPMFEMNIAGARAFLARLREEGATDFARHLRSRPEELRACLALLRIDDANRESLRFFGVREVQDLRAEFPQFFTEAFIVAIKELLLAIEAGAILFETETTVRARGQEERVILLRAALAPDEPTWLILSFVDISERSRHEELLRQIALGVSGHTGQSYFAAMTAFLNRRFGITAAFLAEIGGAPPVARTLALNAGNATRPNRSFPVAGGVCEDIVRTRETRFHPSEVRNAFPADDFLRELAAESFMGEPVVSSTGSLIGVLGVVGEAGLSDPTNLKSILKIFAVRAAGEMERIGSLFTLRRELAASLTVAAFAEDLLNPDAAVNMVAKSLLAKAKAITSSKHGYVASIDPASGDCVIHTFTDMLEDECALAASEHRKVIFPPGPDGRYFALWGHALNTREPFVTNRPQSHPSSHGAPEGHVPLENFLSIPVVHQGQLLGQIALANTPGGYRDKDLAALAPLAALYAKYLWRHCGGGAFQAPRL